MTQDNTKQVRRRRRYSAQFKAELVAEYLAGGVSLASLAISHDINPNILHRWVREHKRQDRHRLNETTGHGASKPGHAITPANWIPVHVPSIVPDNRAPASAKPHHPDNIPVHENTDESINGIDLAGKSGLHRQIRWPTQEGPTLAEFIRELLT